MKLDIIDKQMLCWVEYVKLLVKSGLFNSPLYADVAGVSVSVGYTDECTRRNYYRRQHALPPCCPRGQSSVTEHYLLSQGAHVRYDSWLHCWWWTVQSGTCCCAMDKSCILIWVGLLLTTTGTLLSLSWSSIFSFILQKVCHIRM
jgi:hypothetical protein